MDILRLDALRNLYNETMATADPSSSQYPLMETPHKFLAIVAIYLLVCVQGPRWMESVKPFNLRPFIVVYNFSMVFLSSYIFLNVIIGLIQDGGYSIYCETMHKYKDSPFWLTLGWLFVMSKLVEFIDTVLFILVKKNSHVTFLHVYHHATMACFTWLGFKLVPGGTNTIYVVLNSFVHVVMYLYYGLAAMGPNVRKYLWWKRYLTILQISQFFTFLAQGILNTWYQCPIPKAFIYAVYVFILTIIALFANFYVRAYIMRPKPVSSKQNSGKKVQQNGDNKKVQQNGDNKKVQQNGDNKKFQNGDRKHQQNGDSKKVQQNGYKKHQNDDRKHR